MASRRKQLEAELRALGNPERAKSSKWFFKTGKGEYGEGDRFLGVAVPALRKAALQHRELGLSDLAQLLASPLHEFRAAALEILVAQYEAGDAEVRQQVFDFYLANTARVNNWDLVDASAPYIVGEHIESRSRELLYRLAESSSIWERRIAMVSTLFLIKHGDTEDALQLAENLLADEHDLMHKAVGWMLREIGKVNEEGLRKFLDAHAHHMPRTALRYAIERFPVADRAAYLRARAERGSAPAPDQSSYSNHDQESPRFRRATQGGES